METFSVEPGWGDDGYIAVLENGKKSNQYKAINHSIAWDKALFNWKRIAQFTASKVQLLHRNTGLLVNCPQRLSVLKASSLSV